MPPFASTKHLPSPCQCLRVSPLGLGSAKGLTVRSLWELLSAAGSYSVMRGLVWMKHRWGHLLLKPNDREKQMKWLS